MHTLPPFMNAVLSEERQLMKWVGIFLVGIFCGGDFLVGIFQEGVRLVGIFRVGIWGKFSYNSSYHIFQFE